MSAPAWIMNRLRGELRTDEPLSRHTAWGIGGPAKRFYRPVDVDALADFLATLPETESIFWLGLGSNVLVRDGGIDGTVIAPDALVAIELRQPPGEAVMPPAFDWLRVFHHACSSPYFSPGPRGVGADSLNSAIEAAVGGGG